MRRVAWRALLLACAIAPRAWAAPAAVDLADLEAKTEYAYLTEDRRVLDTLRSEYAALADSAEALARYQYAHIELRRAQLLAEKGRTRESARAAERCTALGEPREDGTRPDAEALALVAACYAYLPNTPSLLALVAMGRAQSRIEAARALEPANPRVQLVAALLAYFTAQPGSAAHAQARAALRGAAAAFDTVTAGPPGAPSWGGAEVWLYVGRAYAEEGDAFAARDAYERALVVAPDFRSAQRRLQALGVGAH